MKNSQLLGACLLGIVSLLSVYPLHADEQIIAFLDTEAVPFKWKENGKFIGPLLDIVQEAKRRTGIDFKMIPMPTKRLYYATERGEVLAAIGITHTTKKEVYAHIVDVPLGWVEFHPFVQIDSNIEYQRIEDLYPLRVGVIRGFTNAYGPAYKDAVASGKIVPQELADYARLLRFLLADRADVILAPTGPMEDFISKSDATDKIKRLPIPIRKPVSLHLMISKKALASESAMVAAQKLEAVLVKMQKEKAISAIYKQYGFSFFPPE